MLFNLFQLLYCCFSLELQYIEDERAKCLDGTLGTYYFQKGFNDGQNKFLVYFEGGEQLYVKYKRLILGNTEKEFLVNAIDKMHTLQGSSLNRARSLEFNGVLSENKTQNYYFYNWNLIHINYCDGVGFQGYKSDIINYDQQQIFFRGELIVRSILDHFKIKFQKAEIIILSGCSIGGVAALQWYQYLSQSVPNNISILCVPDSSILFDMQSMNGTRILQQSLKIMNYIANNETSIPHQQCAYYFPNENWKCFFFQNLIHYIQHPIFIIQPFYDISFLQKYLDIKCINNLTLKYCQQNEMDFIDQVYLKFRQIIQESLINNTKIGSFAPSCINDCLLVSKLSFSLKWTIPEGSNRTVYSTLIKWIETLKSNSFLEDDLELIDKLPWPMNSGCAEFTLSINLIKLINMILLIIIIIF